VNSPFKVGRPSTAVVASQTEKKLEQNNSSSNIKIRERPPTASIVEKKRSKSALRDRSRVPGVKSPMLKVSNAKAA
jgi:hypothetical protein